MVLAKSLVLGTPVSIRFLKAGRFRKKAVTIAAPAPWALAGYRGLRPKQLAVVATLVKLAAEWNNLPAAEKAKFGGKFNEYVRTKFNERYPSVARDLGVADLPRRVRIAKGAAYNESLYNIMKSVAAAKVAALVKA